MKRFWYDTVGNTCVTPCPYLHHGTVGSLICQNCKSYYRQDWNNRIVECKEDEFFDNANPVDIKVGTNKVPIIVLSEDLPLDYNPLTKKEFYSVETENQERHR